MEVVCSMSAHRWLDACYIEKENYHGGTFTGNQARILLKNIDLLQSICSLSCLPFVAVLRSLNRLVKACFGQTLDPNFLEIIEKFRFDYLALDIPVTPKVHSVFFHVPNSALL